MNNITDYLRAATVVVAVSGPAPASAEKWKTTPADRSSAACEIDMLRYGLNSDRGPGVRVVDVSPDRSLVEIEVVRPTVPFSVGRDADACSAGRPVRSLRPGDKLIVPSWCVPARCSLGSS
jgi:hypothetical protein